MATQNNSGYELKDLEVPIEKYPMAESPRLLENFLIIGYEDIYVQEVIYKNLQNNVSQENEKNEKIEQKSKKGTDSRLKEYKCRNLPTIVGSISSNFDGAIFDCNQIIEKVFPLPPSAYYTFQDCNPQDTTNIVFTNIQNNVVNIGYGYTFYEKKVYQLNQNIH